MIMMRRLLILTLLLNWTLPVRAAFDETPVGGRAPGMAGAYSAVANTGEGAAFNPAGPSQLTDSEIVTQYGQITRGTDDGSSNTDTFVGYAHPLRGISSNVLSLSYRLFNASNLFQERTIMLGYSRLLPFQPFDWNGIWSFGVNLKQLHREYQPDRFTENALNDVSVGSGAADPLFAKNGYSSSAFAIDLGVLSRFGPGNRQSASLVMTNANRPDVSLGGDGDKPPHVTKVGYAMKPKWGLLTGEIRRIKRLESETDSEIAVGGERVFRLQSGSALVLRGGYAQGSRQYKDLTTGVSYMFQKMTLDYAFSFPIGNLASTQGTHRLGLSFKLSSNVPAEKGRTQPENRQADVSKETLPEAPQTLVAPLPVDEKPKTLSDVEATAKGYGEMLGRYFKRKAEGATLDERKGWLYLMRGLFKQKGMDLTLVERELQGIEREETGQFTVAPTPKPVETPKPTPEPTPMPTPKPAPTPKTAVDVEKPVVKEKAAPPVISAPVKKPAHALSAEKLNSLSAIGKAVVSNAKFDEAMRFYKQAVQRGLSDRERIEILEALLYKFGEDGAKVINSELERIRKRSE